MRQAEGIITAALASGNIGLPLNRHLTIHWGCYGITDKDAGSASGAFLKCAQQFHQTNRQPFAQIYIHESDKGDGSKGAHTHFLLHVPPAFSPRFVKMQKRWLRKITGKPYRRSALRTTRIGRSLKAATTSPAIYEANLDAVLGYVLKASEPAAVAALGLSRTPEYGRVVGKRCGWSENIGQASRKELGICSAASQLSGLGLLGSHRNDVPALLRHHKSRPSRH